MVQLLLGFCTLLHKYRLEDGLQPTDLFCINKKKSLERDLLFSKIIYDISAIVLSIQRKHDAYNLLSSR